MARDRKRAKQRRERRAPRGAASATHAELHRADLPGRARARLLGGRRVRRRAHPRRRRGPDAPTRFPSRPLPRTAASSAPDGAGVATEIERRLAAGVSPGGGGNGAALPAADEAEAEDALVLAPTPGGQPRAASTAARCPPAPSPSCAPPGRSCSAYSGPTAPRSRRPRRSCSASSLSPASTLALPTGSHRRSSTSSSEAR